MKLAKADVGLGHVDNKSRRNAARPAHSRIVTAGRMRGSSVDSAIGIAGVVTGK
jgi:hypothetical protein